MYQRAYGIAQIDSLVSGTSNSGMSLRTYNNGTYTPFIENIQGNTTTFATAGTEAMRIDSSGRVGIGTTSPSSKLMVNDVQTSGVADLLTLRDASAGTTFNMQTYSDPAYGTSNRFDFSGAYLAFRRSGSEAMRIDSSGNLLVGGTTHPDTAYKMFVKVSGSTGGIITRPDSDNYTAMGFRNAANGSAGGISVSTSSTSYNTSSDYRLKEDWQPMTGASDRVLALNPVNFAWKIDGSRVDGFLAHEVQDVVPEAVTGTKDAMRTQDVYDDDGNVTGTEEVPDYQGIDQSKLVPLLTAALQEALTEIADLKARVTALEAV
jgi:hypothetical protein